MTQETRRVYKKVLNAGIKMTNIGCGQAGSQFVDSIMSEIKRLDGKKDNISDIAINTSPEDLGAVSASHKIHIKGSKGAAGERDRNETDLANNIEEILDELISYIIGEIRPKLK